MPYLAYDFDAFESAEMIGRAAGIPVEKVTHGSLLMWRHAWRHKSDLVTTAHIISFFGCNACEALVLYGQIEASDVGWRIRGAEKWLKIQRAQSESGKTHSANLQRGRKDQNIETRESSISPAGLRLPSGSTSGSAPALAASSQQLTAKEEAVAKKPATVSDPRLEPLKRALVSDYESIRGEKYAYGGVTDTQALKSLLKIATDEVIRARWAKALRLGAQWPGTSSIAGLASSKKWNDLAAPSQPVQTEAPLRML